MKLPAESDTKRIKIGIPYLILLILITVLTHSCIKDIRELEDVENLDYQPSFSIPVGTVAYTLEEIMPADSLMDFEIPDSLIQAGNLDTLILLYNDEFTFFRPELGYTAYFREPVNFSNLSQQSENVESAMLKTNITNRIPVAIEVQGYLLDAGDNVVDSLISGGRIQIPAPLANEDGVIDEPTYGTIYTHFYSDRVDELMDVREIYVYVHLETYAEDIDTVRVYSWNGIELQLALRANLTIPITF